MKSLRVARVPHQQGDLFFNLPELVFPLCFL